MGKSKKHKERANKTWYDEMDLELGWYGVTNLDMCRYKRMDQKHGVSWDSLEGRARDMTSVMKVARAKKAQQDYIAHD